MSEYLGFWTLKLAAASSKVVVELLVLMKPEYGSSDRVAKYSSIVTPRTSIGDAGAHQVDGVLMLAGPEMPARSDPLTGAGIVDVAPTVLHLMGLPVPEDMDGSVLTQALAKKSLEARPVRQSGPVTRWPSEDEAEAAIAASTVDSDDDRVRERLRDLGYVE